jgi:signal transduction histidine kinase
MDFSKGEYKVITASGTVSAKITHDNSLVETLHSALSKEYEETLPVDSQFFLREATFVPVEFGSVCIGSETYILSAQEKTGDGGVFRRGVLLKRKAFLERVYRHLKAVYGNNVTAMQMIDSRGQKVLSLGKFSENPETLDAKLASETSVFSRQLEQSLSGMRLNIYQSPSFGEKLVGRWVYLNLPTIFIVTLVLALGLCYFVARGEIQERELSLQNDWIGNLAHTLRGPVHSIGILIEVLGKAPDAERERMVGLASREISSLDDICRHFIQAARAGRKQIQLSITEVNLQAAVKSIIERLVIRFPQYTPESITLQGLDQIKVKADPEALSEILYNMIDNAMKYSPKGEALTIKARRASGKIILDVVDRGTGFPSEMKKHIGEPFFRGDVDGADGIVGTGLGIYLIRKICDQMDASFDISSDGPGKGASATLSLREAI